ncbi:MAG: type II toxin-antitoxin system RelE/ParE family toxin [Gemmataceae bacterium]|nr:type II toxin-antitoxin system RelE/ParE family toxin [Gemmataceae bacterium]
MKRLASMPSLGSPCEFPSPKFATLRTWPVRKFKKYIIFFEPLDDGVEVIRVLHGARDYPALFKD